jgi:DNA-binding XRE family transcriptional regulator
MLKKKFTSPSKLDNFISQLVKAKRDAVNLSQDDLAYEIGVTKQFIGQVEDPTDVSHYNLTHLNQIAVYFECSLHDLIPSKPVSNLAFKMVEVSNPRKSKASVSKAKKAAVKTPSKTSRVKKK